jgi:hypothetical protein
MKKGETLKRIMLMATLVVTGLITTVAVATADSSSGNRIACFGECTLLSPNRAFLGGNGGVFIPNQPGGQLIGDISNLSFNYSGTGAAPGAPRFSIPISTTGGGPSSVTAFFAFADVVTCNDGSTTKGQLDVINDPTCTIYAGSETFPNWAAFVAAHPTYAIANDNYTFVIQDSGSPQYTVFNVQILTKSRGGN